jgi:hypothetical protein
MRVRGAAVRRNRGGRRAARFALDFMQGNLGLENPEETVSGSRTPIPPPRDAATRHDCCRWQADRPTAFARDSVARLKQFGVSDSDSA